MIHLTQGQPDSMAGPATSQRISENRLASPLHGDAPSRSEILALVPPGNIRDRRTRYLGETANVTIDLLGTEHATFVRHLYDFLGVLYQFAADRRGQGTSVLDELLQFVEARDFSNLVRRCTRLRAVLSDQDLQTRLRKAFHDIRGGSFTSLVGYIDMIESGYQRSNAIDRIFALCRDHLKIMRNAIPDLDPTGYEADLREKAHSFDLMREKWTSVAHSYDQRRASVVIDCDFQGWVSDCCMEFAALDRVVYNLVNNATEHAIDDQVLIRVVALDDEKPSTHLRFAVVNRINDDQKQHLSRRFQDDLGQLFEGGFTTNGHGLGLSICADIVSDSYGLRNLDEARSHGYLGARIIRDSFVAWFHWPAQRLAPA